MLSDLSSDGRAVLVDDRHALSSARRTVHRPCAWAKATTERDCRPMGSGFWPSRGRGPATRFSFPWAPEKCVPSRPNTECEGVEWFPDGKRILCKIPNPSGPFRLFIIEVASGKVTAVKIPEDAANSFDEGAFSMDSATLSPDGASLAGVGGGGDILILSLAGGEPRRMPGTRTGLDGLARPVGWTSDGRQLFIHHIGGVPDKGEKLDLATARLEPWRTLTLEDPAGLIRVQPRESRARRPSLGLHLPARSLEPLCRRGAEVTGCYGPSRICSQIFTGVAGVPPGRTAHTRARGGDDSDQLSPPLVLLNRRPDSLPA